MSARVAPASFHPFIFYCLTFLRFWRFRLFLLAFSFFPLDERVGKTANGTATGASTAILVVVRLGNETHANAGNHLGRYLFFGCHATLCGNGGEIERADALELHRATLRHILAHDTAQRHEHCHHVDRAYC